MSRRPVAATPSMAIDNGISGAINQGVNSWNNNNNWNNLLNRGGGGAPGGTYNGIGTGSGQFDWANGWG